MKIENWVKRQKRRRKNREGFEESEWKNFKTTVAFIAPLFAIWLIIMIIALTKHLFLLAAVTHLLIPLLMILHIRKKYGGNDNEN
ncbi:MAG: hypothetical protein AB1485_04430 [Candidatus Thermoplasmatota archaeon]